MVNFDNELQINIKLRQVVDSINLNNICIKGTYKQGKSYFLNKIKDKIKDVNYNSCEIILLDNSNTTFLEKENSYSPFVQWIVSSENLRKKQAKKVMFEVFKNINDTTKFISNLMNIRCEFSSVYTIQEVTILENLKNLCTNNSVYFICDDIDKWSGDSQTLLYKLITDKSTPWLKNCKFVVSSSRNISEIFDKNITLSRPLVTIELNNISLSFLKTYLNSINSKIPAEEIFKLTGGNIGEILDFIRFFNKNNTNIYDNIQNDLKLKLNEEIKKTSNSANKNNDEMVSLITEMINKSSIIGKTFTKPILLEFSELRETFDQYLNYVIKAKIYNQSQKLIEFTNPIVHDYLYKINNDNYMYHYKLANAIKKIMPTNTYLYAKEMLASQINNDLVAIAYCNYLINYIKKNQKPALHNLIYTSILIENNLLSICEQFEKGYTQYFAGNFEEAKDICSKIYVDERSLIFQKEYLESLVIVNGSILTKNYCDAKQKMENWIFDIDFKINEPYLWLQAIILHDEILSETTNDNSNNTKEIMMLFHKYINLDYGMKIEYYDYLSKNNYTYSTEIQYKQSQDAVAFFEKDSVITDKTLLAKAIANHMANCIVENKQKEVVTLADKYFELLEIYLHLKIFLPVITNNLFISNILCDNNIDLTSIIDIYNSLIYDNSNDFLLCTLLKINLGVILFLANKTSDSINLYEELYNQIGQEESADDYYRYYIINNYNVIKNYNNKIWDTDFVNVLEKLNPYPSNYNFFNARNRKLKEQASSIITDKHNLIKPMGTSILGNAWNFWGCPLMFTDIQYWSD